MEILKLSVQAILKSDAKDLSKLCNISAAIFENMQDINWAGFYILDDSKKNLYLGPFQGKIACYNIDITKGVCGKAVRDKKVIRVKDVHEFEGHIACDTNSQSEIVLPLIKNGSIWGVLDIDSPKKARFTQQDEDMLSQIAKIIGEELYF